MLSAIENINGLWWLCPNSAVEGKTVLKEDWKLDTSQNGDSQNAEK